MKVLNRTIFIAIAISIFSFPAKPAQATIIDPFAYFNVFSLGDITYKGSDFQGTTGAARDVALSNFGLYGMDQTQYVLHAGGNIVLSQVGSQIKGVPVDPIEAAGNITLGNIAIEGPVNSGGAVSNTAGGNIYGNVNAQNINLDINMPVTGSKNTGVAYSPYVDLDAVSAYFKDFSSDISKETQYVKNLTNSYGKLTAELYSGVNVINIDSSTLNDAWGFYVNGPADAILYINVSGANASLNSTNWHYNGIQREDVLLNYYAATALTMTSSNIVNLLAPLADTHFTEGVLTGNLIVGDLDGSGQVNLGHFEHGSSISTPVPVPEPSTLMLLLAGGLPFLLKRSIRKFFN